MKNGFLIIRLKVGKIFWMCHPLESNGYEPESYQLELDHDHSDWPPDCITDYGDLNGLISDVQNWKDWTAFTVYYHRLEGSGYAKIYLGGDKGRVYV